MFKVSSDIPLLNTVVKKNITVAEPITNVLFLSHSKHLWRDGLVLVIFLVVLPKVPDDVGIDEEFSK